MPYHAPLKAKHTFTVLAGVNLLYGVVTMIGAQEFYDLHFESEGKARTEIEIMMMRSFGLSTALFGVLCASIAYRANDKSQRTIILPLKCTFPFCFLFFLIWNIKGTAGITSLAWSWSVITFVVMCMILFTASRSKIEKQIPTPRSGMKTRSKSKSSKKRKSK